MTPVWTPPEEAWALLQRHLDWSAGYPSVALVGVDSPVTLTEMAQRVELYARRRDREVHVIRDLTTVTAAPALDAALPFAGVTVVLLPWSDERARHRCLTTLNELRVRLAARGQGALVIVGPASIEREAAREAADLWAVRTVWLGIDGGPRASAAAVMPSDPAHREPMPEDSPLLFPRLALSADAEGSAAAVNTLHRAARLATTDLEEARGLARAASSAAPATSEARWAADLAGLELAAVAGDSVSVDYFGSRMTELAHQDDAPAWRASALDRAYDVCLAQGSLDVAETLATRQATLARDLADQLGTPEALRDLSISLNNLGHIAQTRGDGSTAVTLWKEALRQAESAAAVTGTAADAELCAALREQLGRQEA